MVEFRRAEDKPVGIVDGGEQRFHGSGPLLALEILVVERDRREVVDHEIGSAGEFLAQCLQYRVRIGTGAQAAGHSDEADRFAVVQHAD